MEHRRWTHGLFLGLLALLATGVPWWILQFRALAEAFGDAATLSEGAANGVFLGAGWLAIAVGAAFVAIFVLVVLAVDLMSGWSRPVSAMVGALGSIVLIPVYFILTLAAFSPFPLLYLVVSLAFFAVSAFHVLDVIIEQHRNPRQPPPPYTLQPPPPRPIAAQPPPPKAPNLHSQPR